MKLNPQQRLIIVVCAIIVIVVLGFIFLPALLKMTSTKSEQAITLDLKGLPTIGNPTAPNKILVIEDLKCPGCMLVNTTLFPQIKSQLIDTGRASYHVLLLSFLHRSEPAGNAAFCLRAQNKAYFFDFVHYVYAHQPPETEDWATPTRLMQMARNAAPGVNTSKLSTCMLMNSNHQLLANNLKRAAGILNNKIQTPTIFVNGYRILHPSWAAIVARLHKG